MVIKKWELEKIQTWTTSEIKNRIWMFVSNGQPIPGSVSLAALRLELIHRNETPYGYHNT